MHILHIYIHTKFVYVFREHTYNAYNVFRVGTREHMRAWADYAQLGRRQHPGYKMA